MVKVMPPAFEPQRKGNRPMVATAPYLETIDAHAQTNPGQWLAFDMSVKEAGSLKRQLSKMAGYDVPIEVDSADKSQATLYARKI